MDNPGLYIHIPYCRSKCLYCSFNSYPCPGAGPAEYLVVLQQKIREEAGRWAADQTFGSIFIGGGTPTIYSGQSLAELLGVCLGGFRFVDNPEVTIETNPNTISQGVLERCRAAGGNRLSIGVQAFDDALLAALGRTHSRDEAEQAVLMARKAGFDNVNLDLMYGLPGQGRSHWQKTLRTAVDLGPDHLALYELTIEPGTSFARRLQAKELQLPDDDLVADMADYAYDFLAEQGYIRYEISNFARSGRECGHNINYWKNGSYLGLGPGAVSCTDGLRLTNCQDPETFMKQVRAGRSTYDQSEELSRDASFRESVIMGMRMLSGVSLADLHERYGLEPLTYYGNDLQKFIDLGLVEIFGGYMKLTPKALPVANQVLRELV